MSTVVGRCAKQRLWVGALILFCCCGMATAEGKSRSPHLRLQRDCAACHTTVSWKEIRFDHVGTGFPLEGEHREQGCLDCHKVEDFAAVQRECAQCHVDYHQGALDGDCRFCHDTFAWKPSAFSHEMTSFPLWGAHGAVDCVQCHANEVTYQFPEPPLDCYDCHERDFGRARVVVHMTAGPDCQTCHTLDRWQGGHDPLWFEIRSGHHEAACGRCHKRPEDYQSHTCIDCHKFSLEEPEHRGLDPLDARCQDCHAHGFEDE